MQQLNATQGVEFLLAAMQTFPSLAVSALLLVVCCACMLFSLRWFGLVGLAIYVVLALTCSNIQVLTGTHFWGIREPVALGTVTFASTYIAIDIVTEYFGSVEARKIVKMGLFSMLIVALLMVISLGHALPGAHESNMADVFRTNHAAAARLFVPIPALFIASMIAFGVSEWIDIWVFSWISKLTQQRWLWLRAQISGLFSSVVDTSLFSVLAWWVFSPQPVSGATLISTYIIGSILMRSVVIFLSTPSIYLARRMCHLSTARKKQNI